MLLTQSYRLVKAYGGGSNDFSGWLTPKGDFIPRMGDHIKSLKQYGYKGSTVEAIMSGWVWLAQFGDELNCSLHYSKLHDAKRQIQDLIDNTVESVSFELLNDLGHNVRTLDVNVVDGVID